MRGLFFAALFFLIGYELGHHGPLIETHGWLKIILTVGPFAVLLAYWTYLRLRIGRRSPSSGPAGE
jgi:hypothetical protein